MAAGGKGIKPTARITPIQPLMAVETENRAAEPLSCLPLSVSRLSLGIENRRPLVLVAVVDAAARHVVRRHLEADAVARKDADAVLAHAPAGIGEHGRAVLQFEAKLRVGQ